MAHSNPNLIRSLEIELDRCLSLKSHKTSPYELIDIHEAPTVAETQVLHRHSADIDMEEVYELHNVPSGSVPSESKKSYRKRAVLQKRITASCNFLYWFMSVSGWWNHWVGEICCIVTSFILLGATVVILAKYDGNSLPRWHYGLSLNTLVAILTTLSTFTLIGPVSAGLGQLKWLRVSNSSRRLDEFRIVHDASRGISGSITLLWRGRGGTLAVAGAILTVLSLFINPFMQQIIGYRSQMVPFDAAYLPIWTPAMTADYDYDIFLDYTYSDQLYGAVWSAVAARDITTFDVAPICSTSNCSWPQYTTLALCSSCANVTSFLINVTKGDTLAYQLPNGVGVNASFDSSMPALWQNLSNTIQEGLDPGKSLVYKSHGGIVLDLFYIRFYYDTEYGYDEWIHEPLVEAQECVLQFCAKTLTASVENNVFKDEVLGSWTNNSDAGIQCNEWIESWMNPEQYTTDADSDGLCILPPGGIDTVCIGWAEAHNMASFLGSMFTASAWEFTPGPPTGTGKLGEWLEGNIGIHFDISDVMSRVASVLTMTKRQQQYRDLIFGEGRLNFSALANYSAADNLTYWTSKGRVLEGSALLNDVLIDVRWAWIALPAAVLLLSIIFFAVVARQTYMKALQPWKQDILPVLYHGLSEPTAEVDELHELNELNAMERQARRTVVGLCGEQWQRLEVVQSPSN